MLVYKDSVARKVPNSKQKSLLSLDRAIFELLGFLEYLGRVPLEEKTKFSEGKMAPGWRIAAWRVGVVGMPIYRETNGEAQSGRRFDRGCFAQ